MPLWSKSNSPSYINAEQNALLYYDESGYWLIRYYVDAARFIRTKEELLVTEANINAVSMYQAGIPNHVNYHILVDDTESYYLSTPDGNPIFIEA